MKICKKCGSSARCETNRDLFESESQIICNHCGRRTTRHYAFWASDAAEEAKKEWELMNP